MSKKMSKNNSSLLKNQEEKQKLYEVEKILDHRIHEENGFQYLIKWAKYSDKYNSWESASSMACPIRIQEYWTETELVVEGEKQGSPKLVDVELAKIYLSFKNSSGELVDIPNLEADFKEDVEVWMDEKCQEWEQKFPFSPSESVSDKKKTFGYSQDEESDTEGQ